MSLNPDAMLQIPPTLPEVQSVRRNELVARPIAAPVATDAAASAVASATGAVAKATIPVIQPGDSNRTREALQRTPLPEVSVEVAEGDADPALSQWLRQTGGVAPGGLPERMARLLAQLATAAAQGQPGQAAAWPTAKPSITDMQQASPQSTAAARNFARTPPGQAAPLGPAGAPPTFAQSTNRTSSATSREPAGNSPALGDTPRQALAALRQQLAESPLFDLHRLRDLLMPALRQASPQSQVQTPATAQPLPSHASPAQPGAAGPAVPQGVAPQQAATADQATSSMSSQQPPSSAPRPSAAAQHMAAVAALLPQSEPDGTGIGDLRAMAGTVPKAEEARGGLAKSGEQAPASPMPLSPTLQQVAQTQGQVAASAKPGVAAAEVAGKSGVIASTAAGPSEAAQARAEDETGSVAPRLVVDGPRLDSATMRQALQVLMQGALQWQGELTPGVRAKILREEAWDRDPDVPGQVAKGAQISVELELPNMGKLRIAGLQIQDSVRLRIMPVVQSRETFAAALDDLRSHLDVAGMPAAQVVLDAGATP